MTCTIEELQNVCLLPSHGTQEDPIDDMNEVYPGIFVGDATSAEDIDGLYRQNIRYVLNAAHGSDTSMSMLEVHPKELYETFGLVFLGIPAIDMPSYPLNIHFSESTAFIRRALQSGKGVLVHCKRGISRSAALVIAYLMEAEGMDVKEAIRVVRSKREIMPNKGFLQQLLEF